MAQRLRDVGTSVTVLSRHPWETAEGIRYTAGDLSTGEGVEAAVDQWPTSGTTSPACTPLTPGGMAGRGASAEEAAVHIVRGPDDV